MGEIDDDAVLVVFDAHDGLDPRAEDNIVKLLAAWSRTNRPMVLVRPEQLRSAPDIEEWLLANAIGQLVMAGWSCGTTARAAADLGHDVLLAIDASYDGAGEDALTRVTCTTTKDLVDTVLADRLRLGEFHPDPVAVESMVEPGSGAVQGVEQADPVR